jgi:hypothetical protein
LLGEPGKLIAKTDCKPSFLPPFRKGVARKPPPRRATPITFNRIESAQEILITAYCSEVEKAVVPFLEKRSLPRTTCCIPVDYCINHRVYRDFIYNVSQSGAYIESRQALRVGTRMLLTFPWIDSNRPVKFKARVVRTDPKGFGLIFIPPIHFYHPTVN